MIADAHCHAWRIWPYATDIPDAATRGSVDQLLGHLDAHGVDRALIVCAAIGPKGSGANSDNNRYVAAAAARHPDRLAYVIDADSEWSPTHHAPGAPARLDALLADHPRAAGITHYLRPDDDGWLRSEEALQFFARLAPRHLVASVSCPPSRLADLASIAAALPEVPFVLHHLGWVRATSPTVGVDLDRLVEVARLENVSVKISGFHYASGQAWNFPYADTTAILRAIVDAFGPNRVLWGSDFPALWGKATYRQALEAPGVLLPGLSEHWLERLMGRNLVDLVNRVQMAAPTSETQRKDVR